MKTDIQEVTEKGKKRRLRKVIGFDFTDEHKEMFDELLEAVMETRYLSTLC